MLRYRCCICRIARMVLCGSLPTAAPGAPSFSTWTPFGPPEEELPERRISPSDGAPPARGVSREGVARGCFSPRRGTHPASASPPAAPSSEASTTGLPAWAWGGLRGGLTSALCGGGGGAAPERSSRRCRGRGGGASAAVGCLGLLPLPGVLRGARKTPGGPLALFLLLSTCKRRHAYGTTVCHELMESMATW